MQLTASKCPSWFFVTRGRTCVGNPPTDRATALGVYRFFRDGGYALGPRSALRLIDM
jgi:hypothetical protein